MLCTTLRSPIGELLVYGDEHGIGGIHFMSSAYRPAIDSGWERAARPFVAVGEQLDEYFEGQRTHFDLPLRQPGGTPFQRDVWATVRRVPYGSTSTYAAIAAELGRPRSARAVGLANARNPFAIIVPCHRLVGRRSAPRGYAGGLDAKRYLLEHEARISRGGSIA